MVHRVVLWSQRPYRSRVGTDTTVVERWGAGFEGCSSAPRRMQHWVAEPNGSARIEGGTGREAPVRGYRTRQRDNVNGSLPMTIS